MEKGKLRVKSEKRRKSIICFNAEGVNKTESIYLNNFRTKDIIIKCAYGNNTDPIGMYNELIKFCKEEDISTKYGDEIFLFIDTDLRDDKIKIINNLLDKCKNDGIEIILSIPSFEVWYLNHYRYSTKQFVDNNNVIKELKKYINDYDKNKNIYKELKDKTNDAITNSQKFEKHYLDNNINIYSNDANPYTGVYKVVEEIIKIKCSNNQ